MAKTILKLHANGNFETVDNPLVQSGTQYKFAENLITVPKIIEYPPIGYRNYFIEKTSIPGYPNQTNGGIEEPNADDRVSDFIDVSSWSVANLIIRYKNMDGTHFGWAGIALYDSQKRFSKMLYDDIVVAQNIGSFVFQFQFPVETAYMRVASDYYDTLGVEVKISVEKDSQLNMKHYLAFEDMPEWVKDTGNPISIFKEGIVIKGEIT